MRSEGWRWTDRPHEAVETADAKHQTVELRHIFLGK